ncbi:MAG: hypothetical protein ACK56I_34145, partial [bacterium]
SVLHEYSCCRTPRHDPIIFVFWTQPAEPFRSAPARLSLLPISRVIGVCSQFPYAGANSPRPRSSANSSRPRSSQVRRMAAQMDARRDPRYVGVYKVGEMAY